MNTEPKQMSKSVDWDLQMMNMSNKTEGKVDKIIIKGRFSTGN